MRTIRALTIAAAVVAALPSIAAAQRGRQFQDAWFWGVKAGGMTFADSGQSYRQAPMAGLEWLITRSHGGLYISGGQAFFNEKTLTLQDPTFPVDSGFREIRLKNMRRLDVALLGFPGEHLRIHPYVGVGFTMSQIVNAVAGGDFANDDQLAYAQSVIQQEKVSFSPMIMGGAQYRLNWASVFGQISFSPANKSFILYNGRPFNFAYEIGVRYNVGTSIDRGE